MFHVPDKFVSAAGSAGFVTGEDLEPDEVLFAAAALLDAADLAAAAALAADFDVVGGTARTEAALNAVTAEIVAAIMNDFFIAVVYI
jgi:hypothetical protein